jgi:hypothetical protein
LFTGLLLSKGTWKLRKGVPFFISEMWGRCIVCARPICARIFFVPEYTFRDNTLALDETFASSLAT